MLSEVVLQVSTMIMMRLSDPGSGLRQLAMRQGLGDLAVSSGFVADEVSETARPFMNLGSGIAAGPCSTTIQIPEANRSLFQYYGVPTGFYNEIYFKEALKQVNSAQDTVNAANLCKIYGTDDLYYEYSVRFKELVRDLLYYSMTTVCAVGV
ncbi:unnamed protein product [Nippostrongylus brasiliensis]|uniref:Triacylglycerol lipase n=1 Tax=Nippostrongylus brasiliensis TaxID=27835 RepID=A0A0N4XK31_NIPBR|nr:unnamed protein product [Nippostrongylus brasiliensis]